MRTRAPFRSLSLGFQGLVGVEPIGFASPWPVREGNSRQSPSRGSRNTATSWPLRTSKTSPTNTRIPGAHVLGPHAEEIINLFAMAMVAGMKPKDIKKTIFAYPTAASDMPYMV